MVAGSIPSAGPWRPHCGRCSSVAFRCGKLFQCFSVLAKRRPFLLSPLCAESALDGQWWTEDTMTAPDSSSMCFSKQIFNICGW